MENLNNLLPHGFCIKWTDSLLWAYVISDLAIAIAYYSIPIGLIYFVTKRKDLKFRGIFILFGAFILACGTTHLIDVVILWNPYYLVDVTMKGVTAVISVLTAIVFFILLPKALRIPSPAQYDKEVNEKLDAYEKLKQANSSLTHMAELERSENEKHQLAVSLQATLDAIPDMLFEIDETGKYHSVHSPKPELLPVNINQIINNNIENIFSESTARKILQAIIQAKHDGHSSGCEIEIDVPAGRKWFELSISKKVGTNGNQQHYMMLMRDITEKIQANKELLIAAIAFEGQEGIIVTDADKKILRVNQAFTEITGYKSEDVVGKTPNILSSGQHDESFYSDMWSCINQTGSWEGEIWNRRSNGQIFPERLLIKAVKDSHGTVTNYIASIADITQSKADTKAIENLAFYDPLTQLPNRRLLFDRLDQAMISSSRSMKYGAILFLDVDNFKILNDSFGHNTGDLLLKLISSRLESSLRAGDTVSRFGGDEFVILLEDLDEDPIHAVNYLEILAKKILNLLAQPYKLDAHHYVATVSMGVTLFQGLKSDANTILKQADIAMYQAKNSGKNAIQFFDIKMQRIVEERMDLEKELRNAINLNEFELFYQIQVDTAGSAKGAEALIRWHHPSRGIVSPAKFIPLAEDTGLINPIGDWVIETAVKQLAQWALNTLTKDLTISVNISANQLKIDGFVPYVKRLIKKYKISPSLLKFEIVETTLLDNLENVSKKMLSLKRIGIGFELDDFGTGYSSLQYLKRLPLHQVKIDQSFVKDIETDNNDQSIVRAIISMGHSLDLMVTAEGVENYYQKEFLSMNGCDLFQGYLFGEPKNIHDFEKSLKAT